MTLVENFVDFLNRRSESKFWLVPSSQIGNRSHEFCYGLIASEILGRRLSYINRVRLPRPFPRTNNAFRHLRSQHLNSTENRIFKFFVSVFVNILFLCDFLISLRRALISRSSHVLNLHPSAGSYRAFEVCLGLSSFDTDKNIISNECWRTPHIWFKDSEYARFEIAKRKLGLKRDGWYACLHVRDGGFYGDHNNYRNADILTFKKAISEIERRGGQVLRMGNTSSAELNQDIGVIDYAHSAIRSDYLDLSLIAHCELFIGQNSGPTDLALLFNRKVVLTNMDTLMEWPLLKSNDRGIMRHLFDSKEMRRLSIFERLSQPYENDLESFKVAAGYRNDDLSVINNSEEEIYDLVVESLDLEINDWLYSPIQEEFNKVRKNRIIDAYHHKRESSQIKNLNAYFYRDLLRMNAKGTLANSFLEKYWSK